MKKISLFLFVAFFGCIPVERSNEQLSHIRENDLYTVYKIDSINSFYLVYAKMGEELFKIVSKKEVQELPTQKVQINRKYPFVVHSHYYNSATRKMEILPENALLVSCFYYDDSTSICLERDSINDLHYAENLKGLYLLKK